MPESTIVLFQNAAGEVPVHDWLKQLKQENPRAFTKCMMAVQRLGELGYEIRRPEADTLRNGISELRIRFGHVNYRLLYTIHNRIVVVVLHGVTKQGVVPDRDIDLAVFRTRQFMMDPSSHMAYLDQLSL